MNENNIHGMINVIVSLLKSITVSKNISKLIKKLSLEKISDDWGHGPVNPLDPPLLLDDVITVTRHNSRQFNLSLHVKIYHIEFEDKLSIKKP